MLPMDTSLELRLYEPSEFICVIYMLFIHTQSSLLFIRVQKMKNNILKVVILIVFLLCISCSSTIVQPYWEIPDPNLQEIAMIRTMRDRATAVIYNPNTCKDIGEACGFFRLHAYAHSHLNHLILAAPTYYPASLETEADCWSAKYGNANEISAAVQLFLDTDRNPAWKIHGDPIKRAEKIRACAVEVGKWTDD